MWDDVGHLYYEEHVTISRYKVFEEMGHSFIYFSSTTVLLIQIGADDAPHPPTKFSLCRKDVLLSHPHKIIVPKIQNTHSFFFIVLSIHYITFSHSSPNENKNKTKSKAYIKPKQYKQYTMRQSIKNMNTSSSSVNEDRNAIRQALAILEQEGVIIGDNDIEIPSDIDIDEGMRIRLNQQARKSNSNQRRVSWSWSPRPSKSIFNDSTTTKSKSSRTRNNTHTISPGSGLKPIPMLNESDIADADSSSSSHDGSLSYSSLNSDKNREVGTKSKRRSKAKRIKPHYKSKKEEDNKNGSKTSIQFSNYDHIVYIPHIIDFSREEIEQCWMNEDDYYSIRSRSLRLVEMMEDTKRYPISDCDTMIVNKHLVCVRGLGEKTTQCSYERDRLQRKLRTAVFRLQQQQKEDGIIDPNAIRQISKKYTKRSAKTARFIGISDEVNV
jgi:hypothetical protein